MRGAAGGDGATRWQTWLAYLIIMLQGFGVLVPWNALLNTVGYFQDLYPASSQHVAFYLTACYTYPQVPLLLVMVWGGDRVPLRTRMLGALGAQAAALLLLPFAAPAGMGVTLAVAFGLGCTTAVYQASVYGLASVLPEVYSQGVMLGMGLAGVLTSLAALVVQAAYPANDVGSQTAAARVYYGAAGAIMLACAASFVALERMPFTRHYLARAAGGAGRLDGGAASDGGSKSGGGGGGGGSSESPSSAAAAAAARASNAVPEEREGLLTDAIADDAKSAPRPPSECAVDAGDLGALRVSAAAAGASAEAAPPLSRLALQRVVGVDSASVFVVFFLTFVVFPSTAPYRLHYKGGLRLALLDGHDDRWQLALLLLFNLGDTVGRFLPGVVRAPLRGTGLLAATLARVVLVVLFVGCARDWAGLGDAVALAVMAAFALTNGWLASLAMMQGPQRAREKDREAAGVLLGFWLQLGILLGSQVAFALA